MNDLLLYEINELQKNYRFILKNAANKIFKSNTAAVLDEINVFWNTNKKFIQCVLSYLSRPYHTYVFTAATILDIEDNEHYPFLCLGDYHIFDDPIYGYINMALHSTTKEFDNKLKALILDVINENIKILDTFNDKIIIFPIRMISGIEQKLVADAASQFFLSMFKKPPESVEEYLKQFNTIEDVDCAIREDIKHMIIFDENENSLDKLIDRFNKYKSIATLPINKNLDAEVFWFTIIGYLSQAFDIMLTCSAYQFVPYVRYEVAFHYLLSISSSFLDNSEISLLQFKFVIAHILHKSFDKEKYSKMELNIFVEEIQNNEFDRKLFEDLKRSGVSLQTTSISKIVEIINKQLVSCLKSND